MLIQIVNGLYSILLNGNTINGPTDSSFQLYAPVKEGMKTAMLSIGRVSLGRLNIKPAKNIADQGAGFFAQSTSKVNLQPITLTDLEGEAKKWANAPEVKGDNWEIHEGHLIWTKQVIDMVSNSDGGKDKVLVPNEFREYSVTLKSMAEGIAALKARTSFEAYSDMSDKMATYELKTNSKSNRKVATALF